MRFFFRRPFILLTTALVAYAFVEGGQQVGQNAAIVALVLWAVVTVAKFACSRRRPRTPRALIAKPSRSTPWGRRDHDVSGCFVRLDPAWQSWVLPNSTAAAKGNSDG
jgi:hypothetical protein